jgi:hypothetical protein
VTTTGCPAVAEVDACVNNPCVIGAECTDLPSPASDDPAGRVCTCNAGDIYMDDVSGCVAEGMQSLFRQSKCCCPSVCMFLTSY